MMHRKDLLSALAAALFLTSATVADTGHDHRSATDDGVAEGIGILNVIDSTANKVNISHGPIPALQWPEMTMDIPVIEELDLTPFKTGEKVQFTIQKGQDNVFRILNMCATDHDEVKAGLCEKDLDHSH